ncbi:MAG: PAS domain S-box protein, partial [Euryarchaeota archaeon]|nr:PAS domain S-box protein [Euryarchaeota archaeon]
MGIWELDLRTNESPNRSPRHDEIFGYEEPLEDWSLETFLDHVHPEDSERIEASFEAAFEIGEWEFETRIVRADGEHRWIAARGEFFDDESEPVRAVGTVRDITKRKEQERRIERQHEQIETLQNRLLETSPTGILVMDSAGAITLANDRAKEIFEPAVGELVGLSYDELRFDLVDSYGEPIVNEELLFERAMQSGETVYGVEIGVKDSAGERVWLSVNVAPMYEDGEITEMVATIEDITERKRATESVERLNDATRELLEADAEAIRDQTADIARQVLDVELAALWAYDSASGDLKLYDSSTDQDTEIAGLKHPDGFDERAWTAFVTDEMGVDNDLPPAADITPSERPIRSGVIVPLGRHGVFCAGSTSPNAFDETRIDLAGTIAGTVETVLDRADNERQLAQQNEELTHLNRINAIIREIAQVLVETDTREAINRTVC